MKPKTTEKECPIIFCKGKENCAALGMIQQAPDLDDLKNTLAVIAVNCARANDPSLIRAINDKVFELQNFPKTGK